GPNRTSADARPITIGREPDGVVLRAGRHREPGVSFQSRPRQRSSAGRSTGMVISCGDGHSAVNAAGVVLCSSSHRPRKPVGPAAGRTARGGIMTEDALLVLGAISLVCAVTIIISVHGLRRSRTTRDFYVASRRVPPWMNASAIAGEYLSAASFLGVAG